MPAGRDTREAAMKGTFNIKSRRAYLLNLSVLFLFSVFSLLDANTRGSRDFFITALFVTVSFILILILHRLNRFVSEAFSIPFVLYLVHTYASYLTGNYWDYLTICLGISCLGALFYNSRGFLKFILISNLITGLQITFGILKLVIDIETGPYELSKTELLYHWFTSAGASLFIYLVVVFAEDKNNEAQKARDSFVSMLSVAPEAIVMLDPLNRVTYIGNSLMELIHLKNPFLARGRSIFDLLKDRHLQDLFYEVLTTENTGRIIRGIALDGRQFFFEIEVFELTNVVKGRLVNFINITQIGRAHV